MKSLRHRLPLFVIAAFLGLALVHGPVAQLPHYHDFADQTRRFNIPHFADVISNLGFALVALWGGFALYPVRATATLRHGWAGYRLFLIGLLLTAAGSAYYHLAPDNARLVWDRLPIALCCGGLLAGVWGDVRGENSDCMAIALGIFGILSVAWWHFTEEAGAGDLRPYLLLQGLPLVLIPLWQGLHGVARRERWAFAGALLLYVAAKLAELADHALGLALGGLTGHTLKHLLATMAAALIVGRLVQRSTAVRRALAARRALERRGERPLRRIAASSCR